MADNLFVTEQSTIITSKAEIDCLEWGDYMIANWNTLMQKNSKHLVLAGIHGKETGEIGNADAGLLEDYEEQISRLKRIFKNDIEKNNIDIVIEDIGFLDSCEGSENKLFDAIRKHNPTTISLAYCYTNISKINSILRSAGLYADLFIKQDYNDIHEGNASIGKLIKFDNAQRQVLNDFIQKNPKTVILTGHYGTGKTLLLINMLQIKISQLHKENKPLRVIVTADIPYCGNSMLLKDLKQKYLKFIDDINATKNESNKIELIVEPLNSLRKRYNLVPNSEKELLLLKDMLIEKNLGPFSSLLNLKGWLPIGYPSITSVVFELCEVPESYVPFEENLLKIVNERSNFKKEITAEWLQKELSEIIMDADSQSDVEELCVTSIRQFRQKYLMEQFMEWYNIREKSSYILQKLLNTLKEEKEIHTLIMLDEFNGKFLPLRTLLLGKKSMDVLVHDNVEILISFEPLFSPNLDDKSLSNRSKRRIDLMYYHLPTKYRISHEVERVVTRTMEKQISKNILLKENLENFHKRLPSGQLPIWITINDIHSDNTELKKILKIKTNGMKFVIVMSKFKFEKYKTFCEEMNWTYVNASDTIGWEIPCLVMFGIPTIQSWQQFISRARNTLIIITEDKTNRY